MADIPTQGNIPKASGRQGCHGKIESIKVTRNLWIHLMLKDINQRRDHKNKHEEVYHALNEHFITSKKFVLTPELS